MASSINASTSGAGGVITTADNTGILNLQTGGTTAVTVNASQNVGIGTTSPTQALTVNGRLAFSNLFAASDIDGIFLQSGIGTTVNTATGNNITFNTGTTERMRIDSSGYIQIGATAKFTDEQLYVNQAANATCIMARVGGASSSSSPALKTVKFTNVNNTTQYHITFSYNNGANGNGAIVGNGDSQAAFATFSDSRLKKNIENLPSQLDKINALRPVEFDYIKSGEHQIGFIAQEVKEVYPDLVAEGENTMLTVTGLGKTEARLIKAIQEQQTIINDLKARVTALEAK